MYTLAKQANLNGIPLTGNNNWLSDSKTTLDAEKNKGIIIPGDVEQSKIALIDRLGLRKLLS
jgi:hypothetical protein